MKTYSAKPHEVEAKWYLIDAEGQTLGRLAVVIADILRGKNKVEYTPHVDTGDFVVVINAGKIKVTGKKETDKIYYHHTQYPGGLRSISFKDMLQHNTLGAQQLTKLKIYEGAEHPHAAQKPVEYSLEVK